VGSRPARAQVAPNATTTYLHPTDVRDARALWVNPAGLATPELASLHFDATIGDPGARGRLRQLTAGFDSRGLAFAYQRDVFDGGVRGHTYRIGIGGGLGRWTTGFAAALYRGETKGTGYDFGLRFDANAAVTVGGVIANIGQPTVRGFRQALTFVPGATLRPFGPNAALSVHARVTTSAVASYSFGLRWGRGGGSAARLPLQLLARLDTDRALRRGAFAFGLTVGGGTFAGAVAATPGDVGHLDALSLYTVSTRGMVSRR
jgi:hypothetical protein